MLIELLFGPFGQLYPQRPSGVVGGDGADQPEQVVGRVVGQSKCPLVPGLLEGVVDGGEVGCLFGPPLAVPAGGGPFQLAEICCEELAGVAEFADPVGQRIVGVHAGEHDVCPVMVETLSQFDDGVSPPSPVSVRTDRWRRARPANVPAPPPPRRELRGWTQEDTAQALEPLLGQRLPQASISAIERAYQGDRRREFYAQEILAFALAFDLPLVWFFLPPPRDHRNLHHTTNIVSELYGIVFGREDQLEPVYDRLRQLGIDEPSEVDRTIENITGKPSRARNTSYRQRRKEMLLALLDQYTDDVDRAAEEIGTFFDHLRQLGIRGLVAERLNDDDYMPRPSQLKNAKRTAPPKS